VSGEKVSSRVCVIEQEGEERGSVEEVWLQETSLSLSDAAAAAAAAAHTAATAASSTTTGAAAVLALDASLSSSQANLRRLCRCRPCLRHPLS